MIIFKSCVQHADLEIQLQAPEELSLIFGEAGITPKQTPESPYALFIAVTLSPSDRRFRKRECKERVIKGGVQAGLP